MELRVKLLVKLNPRRNHWLPPQQQQQQQHYRRQQQQHHPDYRTYPSQQQQHHHSEQFRGQIRERDVDDQGKNQKVPGSIPAIVEKLICFTLTIC